MMTYDQPPLNMKAGHKGDVAWVQIFEQRWYYEVTSVTIKYKCIL